MILYEIPDVRGIEDSQNPLDGSFCICINAPENKPGLLIGNLGVIS